MDLLVFQLYVKAICLDEEVDKEIYMNNLLVLNLKDLRTKCAV